MKLSTLMLFACAFQLLAAPIQAQNAQIKLDSQIMAIEDLFTAIEEQTNYLMVFSNSIIDSKQQITLRSKNQSVSDCLYDAFADSNVKYNLTDKYIVLSKITTPQSKIDAKSAKVRQDVIKGIVVDEKGQPIIGASILQVNTMNGVNSDLDGKFTIIAPNDATLEISSIGFSTKRIQINNKSEFKIILQQDKLALDEAVVIGYGTTSKRDMVGAISSIKSDKIAETAFSNVGEALQGQVPGLVINNNGGQPGNTPTISIRGAGTPLYVIDGVISDEYSFSTINPEDIESMSFLKDASSTAVYGSSAGNGIVLVQTKKGKDGKVIIKYNTNLQLSSPTFFADVISSEDWATAINDGAVSGGSDPVYTDEEIALFGNDDQYDGYPNSDWPKLGLKNNAFAQRHNLSLVGGNEILNFYVSLGYLNQNGLFKSNSCDLKQYNFRSNLTANLEKIGLKVSANINANLQDRKEPEVGEEKAWRSIGYPPANLAYNEDGSYASFGFLTRTDAGPYLKTKQKYIDVQLKADLKIPHVDGLEFHLMGNYKDEDERIKDWFYCPDIYIDGELDSNSLTPAHLQMNYENNNWLDGEASFTYKNSLGKHNIEALALYTVRKTNMENMMAFRQNYMSKTVDQLFAGSSVGQDNTGLASEGASMGYVGRLKYMYSNKYILEFSCRYDGNDNFAEGHKWGFFPAFSGVWIASDEGFMKNLKERNIVNYLKLRASAGETGVTIGTTRFGYLSTYTLKSNQYVMDGNLVSGFYEGDLVDPDNLSWYTRRSYNLGFDFSSLSDRLSGSVDYFYYRTTGYIVSPKNTYSTTLGKSLPKIKSNSAHRRAGYEVTLRWKGNAGKLQYEIGGNASYYNQLWEKKEDESMSSLMNPYIRESQQTDFFGQAYLNNGIYQDKDGILHSARLLSSTVTAPGDLQYKDMNGDGKIDESDKRRIGLPTIPHFNYGIDFSVKYKGWFMNGLIQGTGDRYCMLGGKYQRSDAYNMSRAFQMDYWTPQNTDAFFTRKSTSATVNGGNNFVESDYFDLNAKYVRLKNLQIGYDIKRTLLKNIKFVSSCRISLVGTNLLTISDVTDYFDPESKMITFFQKNQSSTDGYPVMKSYSINLNIEF